MPRAKATSPSLIEMPLFDLRKLELELVGDAPLICHAWSMKAK